MGEDWPIGSMGERSNRVLLGVSEHQVLQKGMVQHDTEDFIPKISFFGCTKY